MKTSAGVGVLTLSASILACAALAAYMLRYEVQSRGGVVFVQDRWLGTVERCVGGSGSKCLPILSAGMKPIAIPKTKSASPKATDEEFKRMMDSLGLGAAGPTPQAGQ